MSKFSSYEKDKQIFDNWRQFLIKEAIDLTDEEKKELSDLRFKEKYAVERIEDITNVGGLLYFLIENEVIRVGEVSEIKDSIEKTLESINNKPIARKILDFLKGGAVATASGAATFALLKYFGLDGLANAAPTLGAMFAGLSYVNQFAADTTSAIVDKWLDASLKELAEKQTALLAKLIAQPDTGKGKNTETPLSGLFDLDDDYQALARAVESKKPSQFSVLEKESLELFLKKIINASLGNLDTTIEDISSQLNHDDEFKDLIKQKLGVDVDRTEKDVSLHMQPNRKLKKPVSED